MFSLIKVVSKSRTYMTNENSRRQNTRHYYLSDCDGKEVLVCKSFFKNTYAVSDGRINRLLKNKASVSTPPLDRRGHSVSANKTPDNKIQQIKEFINSIPSYESHYSLHKSVNRKYLAPDLNLSILYSLYTEKVSNLTSKFIFSKVFNEEFNLSFHAPITDSCKRCDAFAIKLKACTNEVEKVRLEQDQKLHLLKAEVAREGVKKDVELYKEDEDVCIISFDLMKTLPTPVISTGICYYKRQLWTYCLGIHNMKNDDVFMFTWDESVASRGPQEIASCILYFLKHIVKCKHLIMFSDQCGGQNRNIKMALFCQYIVSSSEYTTIKIDHKFLVSGHSYMSCDQDFGLIEKKKRFFKNIFVLKDWEQVILAARKNKPFKIVSMNKDLFFSCKILEKNITNRKIAIDKGKVEWLKMQWIMYHEMHPFKLYFKYSKAAYPLCAPKGRTLARVPAARNCYHFGTRANVFVGALERGAVRSVVGFLPRINRGARAN
ncbi:uncharacterized protein LOC119837446 [Zerene cesonia]|uniref:uncharacterized protein LOC119837446 n=1 Tax=Zerene cesonia TaxID=33412 RepID=UPI0018E57FE3|nr:uncharacterized protein LOC119837446 [Zerene cesonia]